jgi:CubicO group peptidase (beta-lactamase class C family)
MRLPRRALLALPALLPARLAAAQPGGFAFAQGIGTRAGGPLMEQLADPSGTFPRADRSNWFRQSHAVDGFSRNPGIVPSRAVPRPAAANPWRRAAGEPAIAYDGIASLGSGRYGIDAYLDRNPATGLLVARGDTILLERYQYGRTPAHAFLSFSMAKTVTALLVGLAMEAGAIDSLDRPAEAFARDLAGSEYGRTPLRHLLSMSSGIRFREEYDGTDDIARMGRALFAGAGGAQAVTGFAERVAAPGERWAYASSESYVLALVLHATLGRGIAAFTAERLWAPLGAEADAAWMVDRAGIEVGYTGFSATLRDWARLGLMMAQRGAAAGRQVVPEAWIAAMTRPSPARPGYGYQTWLLPREEGFALLGVRGQAVYVDPRQGLVMAHTAVRPTARDPGAAEALALWRGIRRSLL